MTYEEIFDLSRRIAAPAVQNQFAVEWIVPQKLALGRDAADRHLLVLAGAEIHPKSDTVARVLARGQWLHESGVTITGTVLRLHQGEPFQVAATAIATEFLRRGFGSRSASDVFREVESFIELVIRRILLPPNSLLGLVGELLVFDYIVDAIGALTSAVRPSPVGVWRGYTTHSRDFSFNRLAIEVKTTTATTSRHHIGSLDQVEPRTLDGGLCESLFLASFGLAEDTGGISRFSVAQLTSRILSKLTDIDGVKFLDALRQYGPDDCIGYDHATMANWEPYMRCFRLTFEPRLYDMSDMNMKLLRTSDLQGFFVLPEGISYIVDLPAQIPGSYGNNPRTDLAEEFKALIAEYSAE